MEDLKEYHLKRLNKDKTIQTEIDGYQTLHPEDKAFVSYAQAFVSYTYLYDNNFIDKNKIFNFRTRKLEDKDNDGHGDMGIIGDKRYRCFYGKWELI